MKPNSSKYGTEWVKMGMWGQRLSAHVNPPKEWKKKQTVHLWDPAPRAGWPLHGLNHDCPSPTATYSHCALPCPPHHPRPESYEQEHWLYCLLAPHLHASRNAVNLESSPPPPDLNLPDACSPLLYRSRTPPRTAELEPWAETREVLQAILNAVGFHLSLRVTDLRNTKERKNTHNV